MPTSTFKIIIKKLANQVRRIFLCDFFCFLEEKKGSIIHFDWKQIAKLKEVCGKRGKSNLKILKKKSLRIFLWQVSSCI